LVFNSVSFFTTFTILALLYYIIPHKLRWFILVLFNLFFYIMAMGDRTIILLITTALIYIAGILIDKTESRKLKFSTLFLFIGALILSLLYYKYYNFIILNLKDIVKLPEKSILAPIGISFYTFQSISYLADIYKGKISSVKHPGYFFAYLGFFDTILSGPIERAESFMPQLKEKKNFHLENTFAAMELILLGLFKKVVIADRIAPYVNKVFDHPYDYSLTPVLLAFILYTIQLYADFSGYSLMALGFSKILGFNIIDNFKYPYFSKSVKEFWSRWHISLSTFLRDYVYFSLGGSRVGKLRRHINTLIVFTISGIWHGANWTFIFWGFLHGIFVVADNLFSGIRKAEKLSLFNAMITFCQVTLAWVFFRANTLRQALHLIKVTFIRDGNTMTNVLNIVNAPQLITIIVICGFLFSYEYILFKQAENKNIKLAANILMIIGIILLGEATQNSFIYFKF
jgi:alginate O-acetyltransferase complex protein AlgI